MKKFFCALLALLTLCAAAALAETENLLVNGDFSEVDASGMPVGWQRDMWYTDAGVSRLYVAEDGYDGNAAAVVNADENDARFIQTIAVEPDSVYRFSCMVRVEDCGDAEYGATLSIRDTFVYSESVKDSAGEWRRLTLYGQTGAEQREVTLMLRVGGYGSLNTGSAYFDDVEVVQLDEVPESAEVFSLEKPKSSGNASAAVEADDAMPERNTEAYLLLTVLYAILILALARRSHRLTAAPADASAQKNARLALWLGLLIALLVRLVLAVRVRGYNTDINCFSAWSERIYANGVVGFYAPDYFCDYPPGYMLLLWPVAALRNLLGLPVQGGAHLMLLKLIPILCDLLGALLIWRVAQRRKLHPNLCALLALFYAFNPAALIDSAAWGQIDSVFTLLVALCALQAADEKYLSSLLAYAGAMLIKPQAMLFAPLGLFAIVVNLVRKRDKARIRSFIAGLISALALLYATAFAFCIGSAGSVPDALVRPVTWLTELYGSTMGSYSYLTLNTLNLYTLLGFNWTATSAQPFWTVFAWILFGASYVYAGFLYLKSGKPRHLLLTGGLLIALICTFGPMIHERYIFPALLLLTLAYALDRDKRLLASLTLMTCLTAMNELLVLQGGMGTGNYGHLQSSEQWLNALLSLVNVLNALYLCWVCLDICAFHHVRRLNPPELDGKHRLVERLSEAEDAQDTAFVKPVAAPVKDHRLHLKRIDCILMATVTLVYAAVAFVNLGVTKAPQTSWVSSQSGESIVFDLNDVQPFQLIYYGGICNSSFTVELSNDGESWTEPCHALYRQGEIFRWIYYVPMDGELNVLYRETVPTDDGTAYVTYATSQNPYPFQTARYVRITAQSAGLVLSELGFWGADDELIDASIVSREGGLADFATDPALLLDEQDSVARTPSYLNGTYFDEIYHARTAYELQQGDLYIYEWTHPPLGKVLMMLGIELFGMTPFGWRFMGALMGVLMLPLMYLMAKQLTKSTKLSCIAMWLMALDSMHFTQTRIATIDSYAVFWIMLMYLFMFRYVQMDWKQVSLRRTLIPLGLCGVTMGIAIATKWIGAYAAVGLAALFFWKLFAELRRDFRAYRMRALATLAFCLAFFIAIPLLIYYLSYYPQLRCEGVSSIWDMFSSQRLNRVIQLQESMLSYHAGLGGDTHYFRSPWYQWPVIWWPMWYYSGTAYMPAGVISSISCMGNPAVWWTGLIALIGILIGAAWKRRAPKAWLMVLIGFASQFLPWVLVPRSTFIYHYFASVPFIILCTVLALEWLQGRSAHAFKWVSGALLAAALVLFVAFYPLESGMPVARSYAQYLRWFKWYNF